MGTETLEPKMLHESMEIWDKINLCQSSVFSITTVTMGRIKDKSKKFYLRKTDWTGRLVRNEKQKRKMNQRWCWSVKRAWRSVGRQFYWRVGSRAESQLKQERDELCLRYAWLEEQWKIQGDHSRLCPSYKWL